MGFVDDDCTMSFDDELLLVVPSCLCMIVDTGDVGVALDVVIRMVVAVEADDENCDELFEL